MPRPAALGVLAIAAVALIGLLLSGLIVPTPRGGGAASGRPFGAPGASGDVGVGSGAPSQPVPVPGHEVYGFVPYWEMDQTIAKHVAGTALTTVGLFSVSHRKNGTMVTTQRGYQRITGPIGTALIATAHDHKARAEVVYSSFGSDKNRAFYTDRAAQDRWIAELVAFVGAHDLDGVDVDVEVLPGELVPAYGAFVGRLRTALRADRPTAQVSVATQANGLGAAMALAAAQSGADRIFLMGYDFHWAGSEPGASAPIQRFDGEQQDLRASLELYRLLGVPVERTILGLPLYGVTWPVVGPDLGAPAVGRGDGWVPRRNLAVFTDPGFSPIYDPIESVEFYAVPERSAGPGSSQSTVGGTPVEPGADPLGRAPSLPPTAAPGEARWQAVYYDSPRSLRPKLVLADTLGLAGAGFWAIGYERGLPGYTDLIATFRAGRIDAPP